MDKFDIIFTEEEIKKIKLKKLDNCYEVNFDDLRKYMDSKKLH